LNQGVAGESNLSAAVLSESVDQKRMHQYYVAGLANQVRYPGFFGIQDARREVLRKIVPTQTRVSGVCDCSCDRQVRSGYHDSTAVAGAGVGKEKEGDQRMAVIG
jgi:hypothetical protein